MVWSFGSGGVNTLSVGRAAGIIKKESEIMAEKCQIIPKTVFASCETYNCLKPVAWAIGRPDGPVQLQKYYCDQCIRDMLSNLPAELQPEPVEQPKIYPCEYCGEEFDASIKLATHARSCEARKEAIASGEA